MKAGPGVTLVAAACVLAAGCGSAQRPAGHGGSWSWHSFAGGPAVRRPRVSSCGSPTGPGSCSRDAHPPKIRSKLNRARGRHARRVIIGPAATSVPAAAAPNARLAGLEAARLLSLVPVPAHAVVLATAPADPPEWTGPIVTSKVERSRLWQLPMPMSAAVGWIATHPPAGLASSWEGQGTISGPGTDVVSHGYNAPPGPAWSDADLTVQVASAGPQVSVIRADAVVVWLDPIPAPDSVTGTRVRVTVTGGCPRTDNNAVGVTNDGAGLRTQLLPTAAPTAGLECRYGGGRPWQLQDVARLNATQARAVAAKLAALPLAHALGAVTSCPGGLGSADVIALSYSGRPDVDLFLYSAGCGYLANGSVAFSPAGSASTASTCFADGWVACVTP